jgi:hypothetical protein
MARKDMKPIPAATMKKAAPPTASSRGIILATVALVLSFILLIALLHVVGALRGPEEGIYRSLKNVPVLGFLVSPLHHEKWKEKLSPDQLVDVKDMRAALIRTQRQMEELKEESRADVKAVSGSVESVDSEVKKLRKGLTEGEFGPGSAPPSAPSNPPILSGTPAEAAPVVVTRETPLSAAPTPLPAGAENYRPVGKIFEKIPADTVVDILNNLSDREKVQILTVMKEKNVADVLAAFDPKKAAELSRLIAEAKAK